MPSKALSIFRALVNERGERLRKLPFTELKQFTAPTEHLTVESRAATIDIIVQPLADAGVRVVVQGFLKARIWKDVALDGFYKYSDGTIATMAREEFWYFD